MHAKPSYRIIFAGTPEFSVSALQALLDSEHHVIAVYTQPDRPSGRGRKLSPSPIKQLANAHNIPIYQPQTLRNPDEQQRLRELNADIMVVVAYGLLLPKAVLDAPRLGCLNIHASLLPRWRGAAPIQRAILEGDHETGVTIMQMDEGLDTGAMLHKVACPISDKDTNETLHHRLAALGALAILHTLNHLNELTPIQQNASLATYASKITKEEAALDWTMPAEVLARKIRAFYGWPVAFTQLDGTPLRIFDARVLPTTTQQETPGKIIATSSDGISIATGKGVLQILTCQWPGAKKLAVADILNAKHNLLTVGKVLG